MLGFIQNINPTELLLIAIVAILVFGRRLPEVAGQAAAHVQRARRAFNDLRRETGIDTEIREARRTFEQAQFEARLDPGAPRIRPPAGPSMSRQGAWPEDQGDVAGPQGDSRPEAGDERSSGPQASDLPRDEDRDPKPPASGE